MRDVGALPVILLLAAIVDPRLAEPLRLLAEVRDASGEQIGANHADLPRSLRLTLRVAPLPPRAGGNYDSRTRTLTMAEALLDEDPRVVAAGLAHELQHAGDFQVVAISLLDRDCVELEARAFEIQAKVTRAFWPDGFPGATDWEQGLANAVRAYEAGGLDRIRAVV